MRAASLLKVLFLCLLMGPPCALRAELKQGDLRKVRLQLKWYHQFQFAGYYAAQNQGFFNEEGLEVEILEGAPDRPPLGTVLAGKADFGVTDSDVLLARLHGEPVVVCAAIFQHSPYILMARKDAGIFKPSDLVNKRIMVSNDQGEAELRAMLMREGIPTQRVEMLKHSWNNQDLIERRVDAISAYATVEPTQMRQAGVEPSFIRFSDYGVDFYGDTLFTTEELVKKDRALVTSFHRAAMRGWHYAMEHPEQLIDEILAMPGVQQRGLKRENLEIEAKEMKPLILPELVDIGHMNLGRWERMAGTFQETGVVPMRASLAGFLFDPDPHPDMRPLFWGVSILGILGGLAVLWTLELRRQVDLRTRQVREGQEKLSALLDNTFQLQGLLDPEGRLLETNRTAREFIGVDSTEVLGRHFWETSWWSHSEMEQSRLRDAVKAIQEGKETIRYETAHPDKKGVMHDIDFSIRAVRGVGRKLLYMMVEGRDITERKKSDRDRQVSEANLLALVENTSGSIWSLDRELRYLTFNSHYRERTYRASGREPQIGLPVEVVEGAEEMQRWKTHYDRALLGERFKIEISRPVRGATRFFEVSFNPIHQGGVITGVAIFSYDVTEQRLLEQQLRQAQKMDAIGQLAGGVAHDFNNLLTVIQANASLAKLKRLSPEMTTNVFDEILDASSRAGALTRQLLTFSRQQPMKLESVDVNQVVTHLNRMLQRLIGEDIEIQLRLSTLPPMIHGDASMIEQVVLNLAVNARDAMPRGGKLTLCSERVEVKELPVQAPVLASPGEYVRLDVMDTGTGIKAEHLPHLFEPFFTTKEVGKGTGIGLATVFGIAQQHGGWVVVESQEGQGSTFRVFLPVLRSAEAQSKREVFQAPLLPQAKGTILVVEDESTVRSVVMQVLTLHGYTVHEAANGREALLLWPKIADQVDLLLTDMVMPGGITGLNLARQLVEKKPSLKVIYTSGYSTEMFQKDKKMGEEVTLLRKPYAAAELLREIAKLL